MDKPNKPANRIALGNNELSYRLRKGGDRCVLFIHGLGCSKESFNRAFEDNYFPKEYTLLAADLLGHGDSSKPKNFSYALEEQAKVLAELLQKLRLYNLDIVAHSMGGAVALLLLDKINNVNSFVCLEGNLIREDCSISLKVSSLGEDNFVNKIFPMAPLKFRCKGLRSEPPTSPEAFYRSSKSLVDLSSSGCLLEKYKELTIKKMYLYGEENKGMVLLTKLEGLDVEQISDCGHFLMIDNPQETYAIITNVIR